MCTASSLVKALPENLFNAMYFRSHVARGQSGDVANRCGLDALEVEEDDLTIERREGLHQRKNPLHRPLLIGFDLDAVVCRHRRELVETDERWCVRAPPDDLRRRGVVRHAVDPGAKRAPPVEPGEAPPECDVNFLEEIAPPIAIGS